ncbi:MAG: DUF1206 domain-containing protein [Ornithinimicrobium sp.]|uniref:DUF1206 domain-containing protein n=1 Tax=Ornithinimicrobium sp. TaxID=1977084 RepID=UPI003D9B8C60
MTSRAEQKAEQVGDHPALEKAARAGYAMNGLLHLVIAGILVQIAIGSGGGQASSSGALSQISQAPFGQVLLWIGAVGYAGLALWQLLQGAVGPHEEGNSGWADRAKELGKGVTYAVLAFTTYKFATGGGSSGGGKTSDFTRTLMQAPAGQALVFAIGLGVLVVGCYHVYKGATKGFLDDLKGNESGDLGKAVIVAGMVGYIGKGIALGAIGVLFALAALTRDPEQATGMDGALKTLAGNTGGMAVLLAIAVGFLGYGLYSFARAKHADL